MRNGKRVGRSRRARRTRPGGESPAVRGRDSRGNAERWPALDVLLPYRFGLLEAIEQRPWVVRWPGAQGVRAGGEVVLFPGRHRVRLGWSMAGEVRTATVRVLWIAHRIPGRRAGVSPMWMCPSCGSAARKLWLLEHAGCRVCQRLNPRTRSEGMSARAMSRVFALADRADMDIGTSPRMSTLAAMLDPGRVASRRRAHARYAFSAADLASMAVGRGAAILARAGYPVGPVPFVPRSFGSRRRRWARLEDRRRVDVFPLEFDELGDECAHQEEPCPQ